MRRDARWCHITNLSALIARRRCEIERSDDGIFEPALVLRRGEFFHLGPVKSEQFFDAILAAAVHQGAIAQCAFAYHAMHHSLKVVHFEQDNAEQRLIKVATGCLQRRRGL